MYDIKKIKDILRNLRKDRYHLYKKHKEEKNNPYEKYSCCSSQEKLAEALEVERRAVMSWENGKSIPSIKTLIKLCDILDCSIEYLLGAGDNPAISPVAKAAHYSGISSEIISYGLEHNEYLDCLNYFMKPENCSALFNQITLSAWKNHWISQELSDIKNPLKNKIIDTFNKFYAVTPISENNLELYKKFLINEIPEDKINFSSKRSNTKINVKNSLSLIKYHEFTSLPDSSMLYEKFIDYLADYTYKPLLDSIIIEVQKDKLAKNFITLFENYLSDSD